MDRSIPKRIHRWMDIVLYGSTISAVVVLIGEWLTQPYEPQVSALHLSAQVLTLFLLVIFIVLRYIHQTHLAQAQTVIERQSEAMASLLSTVKHELNNDMQVVVGNAELTEILIKSGSDIKKPVSHIARAASAAIGRIDQLSVFNSVDDSIKTAVNLNATLRRSAALLTEKLPGYANVRLELDRLPKRVLIDHHLYTLSLKNLLIRAAFSINTQHEIVLRTKHNSDAIGGGGSVSADIIFLLKNTEYSDPTGGAIQAIGPRVKTLLADSAVVMDLCGATAIRIECTQIRAQLSMQCLTEEVADSLTESANTLRTTTG